MAYRNAKKILPQKLLSELQKYAAGEIIYIPQMSNEKAAWGEKNGSREQYKKRNNNIITLYQQGYSIKSLSNMYHLTQSSIRKVVSTHEKKISV